VHHSKDRLLRLFEQYLVGYNAVFIKNLFTHEVMAGIGVSTC
jgi:hypothetical protein